MNHNLFKNEIQYLHWASRVTVGTDGLARNDNPDWDLRDMLKQERPERYPVLVVSSFENSFDRFGDCKMRVCDFVYLGEFDGTFDPHADYKKELRREKRELPYWIALSEWGNYTKFKREGYNEETAEQLKAKVLELEKKIKPRKLKYEVK